jgi:hypothetical protein
MRRGPRSEPPADPRWLDLLAAACRELRGGGARFEDLYLEQRLELRAAVRNGDFELEACRLEGVAARWRAPSRTMLDARTGISATAIGELLARRGAKLPLPALRPLPAPELDPPRAWHEWAREVAGRLTPVHGVVRYLDRRAAVVRSDGWRPVSTPALVRVEHAGPRPAALLAVWGHPQTGAWLQDLIEGWPQKAWAPEPGSELPVVLAAGTAGALLHEVVGHMAESDLVATEASSLAGLLGATIGPPGLTIVDDPTRFDLAGAFSCDDEGVPAAPVPLVREGRFERFLCDREGARALGGEPGRGRRAGWARPPVARLSNLVVAGGTADPAALEADLERGLVVTRIGSATVDPVAARLVLRVERGWEIRNGRRRRPLAPCELTGKVMEVLAGIDPRIGADPTPDWRLGWCVKDGLPLPTGSEAPSLLVSRLEVL